MKSSYTTPGIYFDEVPPQPGDVLPRMDIAAFVGFAGKGPLHTPVPVEDLDRFRDIFGNDLPLAWNREDKGFEYSYLGRSVEAFFRNGGRRCWVVRVADDRSGSGGLVTHRYPLNGLHRISVRSGAVRTYTVEQAMAAARCGGNWASDLRTGTALLSSRMVPDCNDHIPCFSVDSEGYRLDVTSLPSDIKKGDLIEINHIRKDSTTNLSPDIETAALLAFVDKAIPYSRGIRITGKEAFWLSSMALVTPKPVCEVTDNAAPCYLYGLDASSQLHISASPPLQESDYTVHARLLRLELLVWEREVLKYRLRDLCFHPRHPRFWGNLPDDEELFKRPEGRSSQIEESEFLMLMQEVSEPRFPLAGTGERKRLNKDGGFPVYYLPVGMTAAPEFAHAKGTEDNSGADVIALDGLADFNNGLFMDEGLMGLSSDNLMQELERRYYLEGMGLQGIHCLLPVEEATIISVPDLVHRRWTKAALTPADFLDAPVLQNIPDPDKFGMYELTWSKVDRATGYILQKDYTPDFDNPVSMNVERESLTRYDDADSLRSEPDSKITLKVSGNCGKYNYFRVRAVCYGEVSPWSNSRGKILPEKDFVCCGKLKPELLETELLQAGSSSPPDSIWLSWAMLNSEQGVYINPDRFELERSKDFEFESAKTIYSGRQNGITIDRLPDSTFFYRVRSCYGDNTGPWSNTVSVSADHVSRHTVEEITEYNDTVLLNIHRSLIRFCAARGDMVAVLSVPQHYRNQHLLDHMTALLPLTGGNESRNLSGNENMVPDFPLHAGESRALSYAALYHPWPAISFNTPQDNGNSDPVRFYPPDGPVSGIIAKLSLERGAWIAPANKPLVNVIALEPEFSDEQSAQLLQKRINVLRQDPRGFLILREDTLSLDSELQSLHVRRLLVLLRRLALREGGNYVFESNGPDFHNAVTHYFERILSGLYMRGAFAGRSADSAYRVVAGPSVNTRQSMDLGRFIVELRVAPARALKFIHIRLLQTNSSQLIVQEG